MSKTKSILFTVIAVLMVFFAVMGWHFTDVAETPFWWNFWQVLAIVCGVAFISAVVYFWNKK